MITGYYAQDMIINDCYGQNMPKHLCIKTAKQLVKTKKANNLYNTSNNIENVRRITENKTKRDFLLNIRTYHDVIISQY